MRQTEAVTRLMRATLIAAPTLLLGCPDQEGDPGADCGDACEDDAGARKPCGGLAGLRCGDGEFCNFDGAELACGRYDGLGFCRGRPVVCTYESNPVCGCDGKTYATRCTAHANGVSVEHDGACVPSAP